MKKILLACNQGMSTSFLVEKMKQYASANDIEVEIWAVSDSEIQEDWENADVILLGPQVGYLKNNTEKITNYEVPIAVIDPIDYGRVNGEAVLNKALKLIG
ncbi:PTS sugar transporter subunit IIB [Staphylococcus pseudoxylosus]|uniref:PTS sugar transporter subunit IIB n=1 Tax=Staphylococcus pseudoxylosus TaxID=2282419 RepID=UPI003906D383